MALGAALAINLEQLDQAASVQVAVLSTKPGHTRLKEGAAKTDAESTEVLEVDDALDRLEQVNPRLAEVVMLRYFAGLSVDECAKALELSVGSVEADWRFARAWLHHQLS